MMKPFVALFLITLSSMALARTTFILFDAGETLSLMPVMQELRLQGTPFKVLALATSKTILKDCAECIELKRDCGVGTLIDQKTPHALEPFSLEELSLIHSCIDPSRIVTGAPSKTQLQLARAFKSAGVPVIAYFDALSPVIPGSIGSQFLMSVDEFWVPSKRIAEAARSLPHVASIKETGQPTLETWKNSFKSTPKLAVIDLVPGHRSGIKTVLFAGGYGSGYKESVQAFFMAMQEMPEVQVLISTHPRMGDALERSMLKDFPGLSPLFIPPAVGTMKAMMISDVLVSQNSTTGIQTFFAGKPSIYLDPAKTGYTNFLIENNWSPMLETPEELILKLREKVAHVSDVDPYVVGGVRKTPLF